MFKSSFKCAFKAVLHFHFCIRGPLRIFHSRVTLTLTSPSELTLSIFKKRNLSSPPSGTCGRCDLARAWAPTRRLFKKPTSGVTFLQKNICNKKVQSQRHQVLMGISQARATFLKCDLIHFISQIFVRLGAPLTISRLFMVSNCSIKLSFIQKISYKIVWPLSPNFSLNEILNAPSL